MNTEQQQSHLTSDCVGDASKTALPELPTADIVRLWSKSGRFTRGIYESPDYHTRELWAMDGEIEEPLFTAEQMRDYAIAAREPLAEALTDVRDLLQKGYPASAFARMDSALASIPPEVA